MHCATVDGPLIVGLEPPSSAGLQEQDLEVGDVVGVEPSRALCGLEREQGEQRGRREAVLAEGQHAQQDIRERVRLAQAEPREHDRDRRRLSAGPSEDGLNQWPIGRDVGREHEDVARLERLRVEALKQRVPQRLDLTQRRPARLQLGEGAGEGRRGRGFAPQRGLPEGERRARRAAGTRRVRERDRAQRAGAGG